MKAFLIDRYKPQDGGHLAEIPRPVPAAGQVLVRVEAAGVNVLDSKIRSGEFKLILPFDLPLVLGNDLAGVVAEVGPDADRFAIGDEVFARPRHDSIGTFAEFIAVDEVDLALKPPSTSMADAASIPLVGLTAWQALVERANVQPGIRVFVQAGSGGVGTFAIQLAKHLGATVATTTSPRNAELVSSLGADVVVDYRTQDFETILDDYDVVLHSQDTTALEKSLRVVKPGGRVISLSGPPDPAFADRIGAPWFVKLVIRLTSARIRRRARKLGIDYSFLFMRADGVQLAEIASLVEAGTIRPVVEQVFPLEATKDAIERVAGGRTQGKIVVTMVSE